MRLLSYNIHKGIGGRDRRYRIGRIEQVIAAEAPDLICLQEVDRNVKRTDFHDQPLMLAEAFGAKDFAYQFNVRAGKQGGGYGNLVLSRWPIAASQQISLRRGRRKNRGAQLLVVTTPRGPLHLVHWHLGLAERERHWQAQHLLRHELFAAQSHLPTILVGDTNDWLNTLGHRGPIGRQGFSHATAPPSQFRSFPAWYPIASLDKAFAKNGVAVKEVRTVRNPLSQRASDHLPLVLDFALPDTSAVAAENGFAASPVQQPESADSGHNAEDYDLV